MRFILLFGIIFASFTAFAEITDVDFDKSMGIDNRARYNLLFRRGEYSEKTFNFYRNLYRRNKPSNIAPNVSPKIPKIIHQIWIGPVPHPKLYKKYRDICLVLHPDWEYKLWTDIDIENWDFPSKDLYKKSISYQERADILRYEILYKYGGLYLDADYMCLAKLDELNHLYDLYVGIEHPTKDYDSITISNALIAAKPNHKIFPALLKKIRDHWYDPKFKDIAKKNLKDVPAHRTMVPLTDAIYQTYDINDTVIAFPPTYFMPLAKQPLKSDYSLIDQVKLFFGMYQDLNTFGSIKEESLAYQDLFEPYISPNLGKLQ